ncbi:DNA-directed RNA polymerase subunit N [marine gamma proteobacterium HTCC2207]|uniref:RNA polymerase sigma-54 factor n=1 Tax=gamma proteobacterium HTCC2207 TaxID=314287 RepID=Q1YU16_9GAMM|nr:DNA-directed RNA polymerase subunit N [marine gamma proteobacterium HTCC2207] [gamma proteobacterium HTCC2207]
MRQGLQLKISQQLTMTPQLQQAIRLLQLSTLDLRQEMIEQLYSNPLLEMDEDIPESPGQDADPTTSESNQVAEAERNSEQNPEYEWNDEIPKDVPVDANWDDVYSPPTTAASSSGGEVNLEQVFQVTESFQGHLEWQLNLTPFSDRDREIASAFIDSIDSSGFIAAELSDITAHIHYDDIEDQLHEDELVAVLHRLQQFDPPGVFARSISECLTIQLNQLSPETQYLQSAKHLVDGFLQDIASVDSARLAKKTGLEINELQGALQLVRGLNPRPGESLSSNDVEYIVPDAYVEKIKGRWRVKLNDSNMPRLRINDSYSSLIKRSDSSDQNQFLKDNLAEARWFLRSIESRNETLMRVAMTIVELQRGFLDHGPVAMKPMVLSDIASKLELHESTISRVTTSKYLATPQGIFELKYFFSSHVSTAGGGECSSTAVCAILKELIGAEQPEKPLSDSKLTSMLEQQGIQVARRTVAKYRESLGIPSSSQRKRF